MARPHGHHPRARVNIIGDDRVVFQFDVDARVNTIRTTQPTAIWMTKHGQKRLSNANCAFFDAPVVLGIRNVHMVKTLDFWGIFDLK